MATLAELSRLGTGLIDAATPTSPTLSRLVGHIGRSILL